MAHPKHFVLLSDGFSFKGQQFHDDEIAHIFFELRHTTIKTNILLTSGSLDAAFLEIHLKNGRKIEISSESGFAPQAWVFKDKPEERSQITQAYQKISKRTADMRLSFYLDQLETNGYFVYEKCLFYPQEKVVIGGKKFSLEDSQFSKSATHISLNRKNPSFLDKVAKQWNGGAHFNTQIDRDIIFFLLDKLFNVRW